MSYRENQNMILLTEGLNRAAQIGDREIAKLGVNELLALGDPASLFAAVREPYLWTKVKLAHWFSNASRKEKVSFILGVYASIAIQESERNQLYEHGAGV